MLLKRILTPLFLSVFFICFANTDKYRLIITDNPSTTIMIGWNQTSGNSPVVYYGTEDFGKDWQRYSGKKSPDKVVFHKLMNNHFAKLINLKPNTAYYFVIKDSDGVSKRFWFRTAPSNNDRLSFIAGGDSRNNRNVRQDANKLVSKLKPHAVFFGGDMTSGDFPYQWQQWLDDWQLTISKDGRMIPIIPARGNHEWVNGSISNVFNTPSRDIYYAITFGKNLIRTYTLNSEITAGGSQSSWLKSDLESSSSVIWKMAQYHKPMRPHVGSKSEGNDEYRNWAKLFYKYNVGLVCESDSHTAKSTWPIKPCKSGGNCKEGFERDDENGTVYVGEGCWGAPLRGSDDKKAWTRDAGSFNQFKLVFVSERMMEVRTIRVEDVDAVESVDNNNVFSLPNGLKIWNPTNGGGLIKILNKNISGRAAPKIGFRSLNSEGELVEAFKKDENIISATEFTVDESAVQSELINLNNSYEFSERKLCSNIYAIENKKVKINTEFLVKGRYLITIVDNNDTSITKQTIRS